MRIKRLLKILLVANTYVVVDDNGNKRTIQCGNASSYQIGDMYELLEGRDTEVERPYSKREGRNKKYEYNGV